MNEILEELKISEKNKLQVINEIDKLDKLSESEVKRNLKKYGAEKLLAVFKKPESYFKKYESYADVKELKKFCLYYGIKVNFQAFLARGLSYYNGSIFEIKSKNLKETIIAGGSYMVNNVQATGISLGLERLELLANVSMNYKKVLIISLNQDKIAVGVADSVRELGIPVQILFGKVGKALEYANSLDMPLVVFIGEEEVKKGKVKLKNMNSGKEKFVLMSKLGKELEGL